MYGMLRANTKYGFHFNFDVDDLKETNYIPKILKATFMIQSGTPLNIRTHEHPEMAFGETKTNLSAAMTVDF